MSFCSCAWISGILLEIAANGRGAGACLNKYALCHEWVARHKFIKWCQTLSLFGNVSDIFICDFVFDMNVVSKFVG